MTLLLALAATTTSKAQPSYVPVFDLERPLSKPAVSANPFGRIAGTWDALRYKVWLKILPAEQEIAGHAAIELLCRQGPDSSFRLDLASLTVDSVVVSHEQVSYKHAQGHLEVHLPSQVQTGDTLRVSVHYHGRPTNDGFGGFFFRTGSAYTIGEGIYTDPPSMARTWIPSLDHPSDKAFFALTASVPAPLVVASNGSLQNVSGTDTLTYAWSSAFPMSTYLFALAAADYDTFHQDVALAPGDTVPVVNYVYPGRRQSAQRDYQAIPEALRFFSQKFGRYPFEKYGTALAPCRGAMEHQTLTTISDALVDGSGRYETVFVHELAHHWWGDLVTLQNWADIWLNEGFASYCEVLFAEHYYGQEAARNLLDHFATRYFQETATHGTFSIYDPQYMWGATVYNKGAWVLHMLRFVMGEEDFWRTLRTYKDLYAFANATIRDFEEVAESVSGQDLRWFFDQWIFNRGHPVLAVRWTYEPESEQVQLTIEQVQSAGPIFRMPLEVSLRSPFGSRTDTVWIDSRSDVFALPAPGGKFLAASSHDSLRLDIDPNGWCLKRLQILTPSVPQAFVLYPPYPNPTSGPVTVPFSLAKGPPRRIVLRVLDVRGRTVRTLLDQTYYGQGQTMRWDGRDRGGRPVCSGVYLVVLESDGSRRVQKIAVQRAAT